jgi:tRNA(fMet)-specific endonuclease VapC
LSGLFLLDTSVAIEMRDRSSAVIDRIEALGGNIAISAITRVELEGGVYREPRFAALRRQRLDIFFSFLPVLPFDDTTAAMYGQILEELGFSRRKILDQMIAAQALVAGATLVTLNPQDFEDVPNLEVLGW